MNEMILKQNPLVQQLIVWGGCVAAVVLGIALMWAGLELYEYRQRVKCRRTFHDAGREINPQTGAIFCSKCGDELIAPTSCPTYQPNQAG